MIDGSITPNLLNNDSDYRHIYCERFNGNPAVVMHDAELWDASHNSMQTSRAPIIEGLLEHDAELARSAGAPCVLQMLSSARDTVCARNFERSERLPRLAAW